MLTFMFKNISNQHGYNYSFEYSCEIFLLQFKEVQNQVTFFADVNFSFPIVRSALPFNLASPDIVESELCKNLLFITVT